MNSKVVEQYQQLQMKVLKLRLYPPIDNEEEAELLSLSDILWWKLTEEEQLQIERDTLATDIAILCSKYAPETLVRLFRDLGNPPHATEYTHQ